MKESFTWLLCNIRDETSDWHVIERTQLNLGIAKSL